LQVAMVLAPMARSIAKLEDGGYVSPADAVACREHLEEELAQLRKPRGISWPTAAAIIIPIIGALTAIMGIVYPTFMQELRERKDKHMLAIQAVQASSVPSQPAPGVTP